MPNVNASCFAFQVPADDIQVSPIAVPFQVPVPIVPKVVIFAEPANVEIAVFSTLSKLKAVFNSPYEIPLILLVPVIKRSLAAKFSSNFNAFVSSLPNVNAFCFPFQVLADDI